MKNGVLIACVNVRDLPSSHLLRQEIKNAAPKLFSIHKYYMALYMPKHPSLLTSNGVSKTMTFSYLLPVVGLVSWCEVSASPNGHAKHSILIHVLHLVSSENMMFLPNMTNMKWENCILRDKGEGGSSSPHPLSIFTISL